MPLTLAEQDRVVFGKMKPIVFKAKHYNRWIVWLPAKGIRTFPTWRRAIAYALNDK